MSFQCKYYKLKSSDNKLKYKEIFDSKAKIIHIQQNTGKPKRCNDNITYTKPNNAFKS